MPTKTVIDCGEPFYITDEEIDILEANPDLEGLAIKIKDAIEFHDKCILDNKDN